MICAVNLWFPLHNTRISNGVNNCNSIFILPNEIALYNKGDRRLLTKST